LLPHPRAPRWLWNDLATTGVEHDAALLSVGRHSRVRRTSENITDNPRYTLQSVASPSESVQN
jgi:hypothetical protein